MFNFDALRIGLSVFHPFEIISNDLHEAIEDNSPKMADWQ
jgi:hypothetical protein